MKNLRFLYKSLIFTFWAIETGYVIPEYHKSNTFEVFHLLKEENLDFSNELFEVHNKFGNLIYGDSMISYICLLNIYNYAKENNILLEVVEAELELLHEIVDINQIYEDAKEVITLKEFTEGKSLTSEKKSRLITDRTSESKYVLDASNTLWAITKEKKKIIKVFSNVKDIFIDNTLLMGIDTDNKFWYVPDNEDNYIVKTSLKSLEGHNIVKIFKYITNQYILVTTTGKSLVIDRDPYKNTLVFEGDELTVKNIIHASAYDNNYMILDDKHKRYGQLTMNLEKVPAIKSFLYKNRLLILDKKGKVWRRDIGFGTSGFTEVSLKEKIKDVAEVGSTIIYLTENGNVYGQRGNYTETIKLAEDIDYLCESKYRVYLVNENKILTVEPDIKMSTIENKEDLRVLQYIDYVKVKGEINE